MAKRKVNKTAIVTQALEEFPEDGPKEIAARITKQGVKMTAGYVSTIKSALRRKGTTTGTRKHTESGATISVDALKDAVDVCNRHGVQTIAQAVDVIEQIHNG